MERDTAEEIDFQRYWFILKRRWLPASVVFITVLTLATLFGLTRKPTYEAESRLLFQTSRASSLTGLLRESQGNSSGELGRLESLGRENNPLDTQAEIMRSIPIAQQTIEGLNLKDKNGKLIEPDVLIRKLTIKIVPTTDILRISYRSGNPEEAAKIVNKLVDVFIQQNVQSNRAEPIAAREFIASQLPKTELAVQEADQALREFKEKNGILVLEQEASAAVSSISNLNGQIAQTQAQLGDLTAQSRKLQNQLQTDPQQSLLYAQLSQSSGVQDALVQLQQAQRELAVQQSRFSSGPPITKLKEKVTALDILLKRRVKEISGDDVTISTSNLQLGDTSEKLSVRLAEIESQRLGLIERLNILSNVYIRYKNRASNIPELEKTQRELERRLGASQKTYEALLSRLQTIQVTENQNIGNTRIVSRARVPRKPMDSQRKLFVLAGALGGLLLGVATAFLLDFLDRSVKTVREGREQFGYTFLGVIPAFSQAGRSSISEIGSERTEIRIVNRDIPSSIVIEAYQMLQANLKFLSSDQELKSIVVTSSVTGEGKTEVSSNLAVAIAQSGRRVLLVDACMRRPTLHNVWDLSNLNGLSHILVGQSDVNKSLHEVMPGLFVLPSGIVPPNAIALLDSNRMVTLIDEFSGQFDFIIFDTPAITSVADALVLGRMVDGIVLVLRPGVLTTTGANAAKEMLRSTGQKVLGMVANGVDVRNEPDSYFHYGQDDAIHQIKDASISRFSLRK